MFEDFPYTNLHQLNLDWLVDVIEKLHDNMVISVNGQTGEVLLYQNATMQLPDVSDQSWTILRNAHGVRRGIKFDSDGNAYIVAGNSLASVFTPENPPASSQVTYDQYVRLTTLTGEQLHNWNIFRTLNNQSTGIEFDDTGDAYIISGSNRYKLYSTKNPIISGVSSVNGQTGDVVLYTDSNGEMTMPGVTNPNVDAWSIGRTINGTACRIYIYDDGQVTITAGSDEYRLVNSEELADLAEEVETLFDISQIKLNPTWTDGKYVAGNNVEIASQYYSIADYNVTDIQGDMLLNTFGEAAVGWILLDANNNQIERSLFTDSTGITYNFKRVVHITQNAALLRVSCTTALKDSHAVVYLVRDNDFLPCTANAATKFNSVRKFSAYSVEVSNLTTSANNVPYNNFHGTIITVGKLDASQQQLALSYDQRMFIRRKFNTWSAWKEMAIGTPTASTASTNFNSVTNPFFYCGIGGLTAATNHVPYDNFNGCVYNIDYGGNFGSQIAVSSTGRMFIRYKYVNWSDWIEVITNDRFEAVENDYDILSEFDNIFCAGDSLTWGAVYTGSGSSDYRAAKKPYNAVLQLRTGVTVARNAQPGIDAIGYVSKLESITEKTNQLVIIYLGTNGGLTDTLDTDAPGMDKTQYDLTTETGSYAYIVKHCLDVNAKVLLVKIYGGGGSSGVTTTNSVIDQIATKFNVAVIDNKSLPAKYHIWPNGQGYDDIHLNDFGYAAFAEYLIRQTNMMPAAVMARILPSA